MNPTLELFDDPRASALPPGLTYRPNFIKPADEAALLLHLRQLDFAPYEFRGVSARRRVIAFGYQHDYKTRRLGEAPALPSFLESLREQVAAWLNCEPTDFRQALVSEYRPGTPIGWHKDRAHYDLIVGISLLSSAILRLRREDGAGWQRSSIQLTPRSAYVLAGSARSEWQHSIPPVPDLRYSITFRTMASHNLS